MNTHKKSLGEIYRTHEWLDDTRVWRCALLFNKLAFGVSFPTGSVKYTISGTVYDANGTTAVANATVALSSYSATSAANGTYTISNVPAGTSGSMTCTLAGYRWTAITVAAMSGNLTAQNYTNAWWAAGGIAASAVAAYKPKAAADYATSKVNLVNPGTYNCTDGAAYPTWDSTNGWKFAGASSQYLDAGFPVAATGWSYICQFSNVSGLDGYLFGVYNNATTTLVGIAPNVTANLHGYWNGRTYRSVSLGKTSGNLAICATKGYFNDGAADDSGITNAFVPTGNVYIGGLNKDGTLTSQITAYIQAIAFYNSDISAAISPLYTAMAAL